MRKVAFTGSTPVGERVHALAAVGSKRVTLELGGSDPMIICDDADLKAAASAAAMGRFYNCGQACLAIKRLYVFESVADEVIEAVAAKAEAAARGHRLRPRQPARPAAHREPADELERQIAESGGEILAGGGRPEGLDGGWFHEPTVVARAGPRLADGARGGLRPGAADLARARTSTRRSSWPTTRRSASARRVWTSDLDRAERAAAELDCGYTWINSRTKVYDELPFGGLKASGYGKEHGSEALDYYTDQKSVVVKRAL